MRKPVERRTKCTTAADSADAIITSACVGSFDDDTTVVITLKTLPSSTCISDTSTGDLKTDLSKDSKIMLSYGKSSTRVSNANLSARKLWNNVSKMTRNSVAVNDVIEEESELIGMLTKQLHQAESQMRKMQSVLTKAEEGLRTKDQEVGRLKRKIKEWETKYKSQELLRKKEQRNQASNSEYFYQRCLTLEHKISEMEKFLADYGLIWVGDPKNTTNVDGSKSQIVENRLRLRSKSASSSGERLGISQSVLRSKTLSTAEINNINELKITNLTSEYFAMKHPRGSRSATCARKSTPPLLRQVNEAIGKSNELRLKVRSLTGSTIYLVHVLADESVAKLYELLDKAMQTSGHRGYKVVLSGYSPKRLLRVNTSLKESGINRDCVLHLVND
ncbi:Uncharacterized protein DBV15_01622 [Temnothorax longispinosus]|uniref:UBX domain-containing protein 11 n=1 Tax=Temnothorax longispinosus TaxID=300112 RepID=A0A4S2KUC2_9HYME|nr:Uncharacterized protein DBV15_01622 [Temnothorax longispinosus]